MMFETPEQHVRINRAISEVWEDIRDVLSAYDGKVSSVDKLDSATWYFTFSFSRSLFMRFSLALISGKIVSKEDNASLVNLKSRLHPFAIFIIIALILGVLISGATKLSVLTYALKLSIMGLIILFSIFMYNKEAKFCIDELLKKLNAN